MGRELGGTWTGPAAGAVLADRYELGSRLGRGGMAQVWSAQDRLLQRPVALKLFCFDTPAVDVRRVQAEMRMLASLNHPSIVTVYDAGTVDNDATGAGAPYLVMELVEGPSLAQRLSQGPLVRADVVAMADQLAAALGYLHGRGIVHRDIKPANILSISGAAAAPRPGSTVGAANEDGAGGAGPLTVQLADFGIARLIDSTSQTATGTTLGTANYLAPEQATGALVGPPADIYSLGLVLLESLTGRIAYPGHGVEAAVARLHRPPRIGPELGPVWTQLLSAMTAQAPEDRPSAAELCAAVATDRTRLTAGAVAPPPSADESDSVDSDSTAVLAGPGRQHPGSTVLLPTSAPPVRAVTGLRRRLPRRLWLTAAAAATVVAAVLVGLAVSSSGGSGAGSPAVPSAPSYPAVGGTLGTHLRQLEGAIG